jgi:hypothetical protein
MIPHRQVAWNGYNTVCCWQLRADDVSPIFTPLYHAGGLLAFLVPIFTIGGTIVLHRAFDAGEIWRTIERERATVVLGVPTIWKLLAEAPEFASADLSSLRCLYSGGAPLPTWTAEIYPARVVFEQGFGMTEVGVNCFAMSDADSVRKRGSIGTPVMHTEVRLVDGEGHDVPVGDVGELWFRGPHVALGYWHNPEATAEAWFPDGWFRSGDLARRDAEGFFYIAGRRKELIISGGVNVYPAEIEAELLQHPGVRDAAVVGIEHLGGWGRFQVPLAKAAPVDPPRFRRRAPGALPLRRSSIWTSCRALPTEGRERRAARVTAERGRDRAPPLAHLVEGEGPRRPLNGGMMSFPPGSSGCASARAAGFCVSIWRGSCSPRRAAGDARRTRRRRRAAPRPPRLELGSLIGTSYGARQHRAPARAPERALLVLITAMDCATPEFRRQTAATRAVLAEVLAGGDRGRFFRLYRRRLLGRLPRTRSGGTAARRPSRSTAACMVRGHPCM